ncbi:MULTISPECIES: ABC transporter permease subunit [Cryobacterium]|uniref:ABC transporter permease subunit n=1 Tax=Cryobacterium TaxID=69578 RepID=UPI000CD422B1|nr:MULTISPECIES: ABC transporter permease subunit [Cryobacterium]POH64516.1 maltose ABC transporter permease [Cryobacterium zongtaii]TFC47438.1 ABC transporter permease subunit [Cryobacterium sp. TMN-39-2]
MNTSQTSAVSRALTDAVSDRGRQRPKRPARRPSEPRHSSGWWALAVKVVLLAMLDAIGAFAVFTLITLDQVVIGIILAAVVIVLNIIYLKRDMLPAKYLAPGLIFLVVFQVLVVVYTGYIAFTNYGDQHNSTKQDAIEQIIRTAQGRVPDSPQYGVNVYRQGDRLALLVEDPDGELLFGTSEQPLETVDAAPDGWTELTLADVVQRQADVLAVVVPISDDLNDGSLRTPDGSSAYVFASALEYDETTDTFTDTATGGTYADDGEGTFRSSDGAALNPGWRVFIGADNFAQAFTNDQLRDPLLRVIVWTFAFAFLSVALTFAVGVFLALVFNHPRVRGRKIFRAILILPYAFPVFLSGLVWAGMLNTEFGFINQTFFAGADIPWLADPWLARISVLVVNLWLGFPYMFLVCTGALQSLPDDVIEAARVDGARAWRIFRSIKLPLMLVSIAPLLIASFAFNFNNFNVIYMLTRGWPRFTDTTLDIGATDLLITVVYKVAFGGGGGRDYGLASAFAILIFIIVAVVSIVSFRRTRSLEEIN